MKKKSGEQEQPKKKKKKKAKKVQQLSAKDVSVDVAKENLTTENVSNVVPVSDVKKDDHAQENADTAVSYLLVL